MRVALLMRWAAAPALLLCAAPAAAQASDSAWERCLNEDDNLSNKQVVGGCTEAIESGKLTGRRLAGAYNNRAIYYSRMGDMTHAMADADEAVRIDPDYAGAYQTRARMFGLQGNHARAAADMRVAVRLTPEHPGRWEILCWSLALARQDLAEARTACDTSLKLRPDDANTLDSRGMVGLRQHRYQDAWNDYDAAFRLDPKAADSLYGRGVAALRLGRASGRDDIDRATEMDGNVPARYEDYGETP